MRIGIVAIGLVFIMAMDAFGLYYVPGYPDYDPLDVTSTNSNSTYPSVDVSGFFELSVSGRNYSDDINKLQTIRSDEYYKKIPNDVLKGPLSLDNRYNISANGLLADDANINFEISKEPDLPLLSTIKFTKGGTQVQLGYFNTDIYGGKMIQFSKSLDGVMIQADRSTWASQLTLGKERSEPQIFMAFGNNTRTYKLGKSFILEGSVRAYLNNRQLVESVDYDMNYYDGTITLRRILTAVDQIRVIYEFTNPIQDFIPSLSRRNFTAITYTHNPSRGNMKKELETVSHDEVIIVDAQDNVTSKGLQLAHSPIQLGSESIQLNDRPLRRGVHYIIKNETGLIQFQSISIKPNDAIHVTYRYYDTDNETQNVYGNGTPGPYKLSQDVIRPHTLTVYLGDKLAKEFIDYIYNKESNGVEFMYDIPKNKRIKLMYEYKKQLVRTYAVTDSPYSLGFTYVRQSTVVRDDQSQLEDGVAPLRIDGDTIVLSQSPIDPQKAIVVTIDGRELNAGEYSVNYYEGKITVRAGLSDDNVKVTYSYLTSIYAEHSIRGLNQVVYNQEVIQFRSLPIQYNGIQSITIYEDDDIKELEEGRDYTVEYINDGTSFTDIKIKFILTGDSILSRLPGSSDVIRFKYYYIPQIGDTQMNSSHQIIGAQVHKKVTDTWNIYGEFANAQYNYAKTTEFKKDTFTRQSSNNEYQLSSYPVKENSELVFINGFSQTRDTDYYIDYEEGRVAFINVSIPDNTEVEILYEYFLSNTPNKGNVNAYLIESDYASSGGAIELRNRWQKVDPNFISIGNVDIDTGTTTIHNEFQWNFNSNGYVGFSNAFDTVVDNQYDTLYKRRHYLSMLAFDISNWGMTHEFRYDDAQANKNYREDSHEIIQYSNTTSYSYGERNLVGLTSGVSRKNEILTTDVPLTVLSRELYFYNNHYYSMGRLIQSGHLSPYAGVKIDHTNVTDDATYTRKILDTIGVSSFITIRDGIQNDTMFDRSVHRVSYVNDPSFKDVYYNYSNASFISPYPWLNAAINLSHEEAVSPIPGQSSRQEDRQSYGITRMVNDAALEWLRVPKGIRSIFRQSTTQLHYNRINRNENNQMSQYTERQFMGGVSEFQPISGLNVSKTSFQVRKGSLSDQAAVGSQVSRESVTSFYSILSNGQYKPSGYFFNRFSLDGRVDRSKSLLTDGVALVNNVNNKTNTTVYRNVAQVGMTVQPAPIPIGLTRINNASLRLDREWENERDQTTIESTDPANQQYQIDTGDRTTDRLTLSYTAFKTIKFMNQGMREVSFFNRNVYPSMMGSLLRQTNALNQRVTWSLFRIKNNTGVGVDRTLQHKTSTINVFPDQITTDYENRLRIGDYMADHESSINVSSVVAIVADVGVNRLIQSGNDVVNGVQTDAYVQKIQGRAGVVITPITGLDVSYKYGVKQLESTELSDLLGNDDNLTIIYNPIKYKNVKIQAQFSIERNWGFGFNSIEKEQLLQTSNEVIQTDIIARRDQTYLGSLVLNVNLPIRESRYLESVVLTGEGYLKVIRDQENPINSLRITGSLVTVRMNL